LKPLAGLTNLRTAVIDHPDLIDVFGMAFSMGPQAARTQLGMVVNGYGVTEQGVAWLRETMPLLRVVY